MAKIYAQKLGDVWKQTTASLVASGSVGSGAIPCGGYTKLLGVMTTSGSGANACALRIRESIDGGANWDIVSSSAVGACSANTYSFDIVSDVIEITYFGDTTADTDEVRTKWMLRPV